MRTILKQALTDILQQRRRERELGARLGRPRCCRSVRPRIPSGAFEN